MAVFTLLSVNAACAEESEDSNDTAAITATASVDKNDITIGDKITLLIQVRFQGNVTVSIPDTGDRIGVFVVKNAGEAKEVTDGKNKSRIVERSYVLSSYKTGLQTIPAIEIEYNDDSGKGIIATNEIEINIKGILTEGENVADVRDISPPVDVNTNFNRLFQWIFTGVAAVVLFFFVYRMLKKRKKRERIKTIEVVKKLPHETAYELLEMLAKENLIDKGLVKEYYYRITNILRHYIEDRFGMSAPERTTEEFMVEMAYTSKLNNPHKKLIREFLEKCDMVKYAKYGPSFIESQEIYHLAKRLIDETKSESEVKKEETVIIAVK